MRYIVERARDRATATTAVSDLLEVVKVIPLASEDFHRALALGLRDFEDAVQVEAALRSGAQYLITRNARDFRGSPIDVRSPAEAVAVISAELGEEAEAEPYRDASSASNPRNPYRRERAQPPGAGAQTPITSLGSAILEFLASGAFKSVQAAQAAQAAQCPAYREIHPELRDVATYEKLYTLYRELYFALGVPKAAPLGIGHLLPSIREIAAGVRGWMRVTVARVVK